MHLFFIIKNNPAQAGLFLLKVETHWKFAQKFQSRQKEGFEGNIAYKRMYSNEDDCMVIWQVYSLYGSFWVCFACILNAIIFLTLKEGVEFHYSYPEKLNFLGN